MINKESCLEEFLSFMFIKNLRVTQIEQTFFNIINTKMLILLFSSHDIL